MLDEKIKTKKARLAIVGLGYVGLPLAVEFAGAGFAVYGIDVDNEKVKFLNKGKSYIEDIPDFLLRPFIANKKFISTTDFSILKSQDVVVVCVPTPLRKSKDPDISYILSSITEVARYLHKDQLVILESTTYPGTTQEIVLPLLAKKGLRVGTDFNLAFSPERVDPGNKKYKIRNTPKVVGGITKRCTQLAQKLYMQIVDTVIPVSSTQAAEMVKLLENTFRAVNIGLVNEVALMCDKLRLDTFEIIEAASTKPFGFLPFYPGPGIGGHCIPLDIHYLSWKLKTLNFFSRFIELAGEINSHMPEYVVSKIQAILNDFKKPIRNSKILVLGVAYKKDVSDTRESPALDVISILLNKKASLSYSDPYVKRICIGNKSLCSVKITPTLLASQDCVVIATNHSSFDYKNIIKYSRIIFDSKNATKGFSSSKIIKL
ncbi:MAG: nucleotide sugar dehydrogenase [bacterium]